MKIKEFGFFSRHLEKLVLGLGVAVLVVVAATRFLLSQPNAVEIGGKPVSPGEIKDEVMKDYERLKRNLSGDSYVPDSSRIIAKFADSYVRLYELPVTSGDVLAPLDGGGLARQWLRIERPEFPTKVVPYPPTLTGTLAKAGHGVLDDDGSPAVRPLFELIGSAQPHDFSYASVSAIFSVKDWVTRLEGEGVPSEQRVERGLWDRRLLLTSVRLLREELDPLTELWGGFTVIDPLPGQLHILPEDVEPRDRETAQRLEAWVNENQGGIQRPVFPTINNGPWTPPDQRNRVLTDDEIVRQQELEDLIRKRERELKRLRPVGRGGNALGRGGGDGLGDFAADGLTPRQAKQQARIQEMQNELREAQAELDGLLGTEHEETVVDNGFEEPLLGGGADRSFAPRGGRSPFGNPNGGAEAGLAYTGPDTVKVWAHDLTAEPGKTYRYKVAVSVMNPLYQFPRLNEAQRRENFDRVAITHSLDELAAAPWSAPLTLDPEYYFFALSGSKDLKRAKFEVWTVRNGRWLNREFTEFPGNEIGGSAEDQDAGDEFNMNVGAVMLDVDSVRVRSGQGSVRVLFLNPLTGRIDFRLVSDDKNSTDRQRLENELRRQGETPQQAGAGR